jgi:hypothetical protein
VDGSGAFKSMMSKQKWDRLCAAPSWQPTARRWCAQVVVADSVPLVAKAGPMRGWKADDEHTAVAWLHLCGASTGGSKGQGNTYGWQVLFGTYVVSAFDTHQQCRTVMVLLGNTVHLHEELS